MKRFNHISGQHVNVNSAKIYFETAGDKGNPFLLLLHGGFGNIEDFNTLVPLLTEKFHVLGIDSRGQGKSTMGNEKLSYERIQLDVEAVLQFLHIDKLNILGFSDGGIVAYRLAAFSSLNIEKLITIGSRWCYNDAVLTREIFNKVTPGSWKKKFPDMYSSYQRLNPEPDFDFLTASVVEMWLDPSPSGYPNEHADHITCPVLIVRGDNDHLVFRNSVTDLSGRIKNASLLNIPFAGHMAFHDQAEVFNIVLNQFLAL